MTRGRPQITKSKYYKANRNAKSLKAIIKAATANIHKYKSSHRHTHTQTYANTYTESHKHICTHSHMDKARQILKHSKICNHLLNFPALKRRLSLPKGKGNMAY